jgi:hypothetical protein
MVVAKSKKQKCFTKLQRFTDFKYRFLLSRKWSLTSYWLFSENRKWSLTFLEMQISVWDSESEGSVWERVCNFKLMKKIYKFYVIQIKVGQHASTDISWSRTKVLIFHLHVGVEQKELNRRSWTVSDLGNNTGYVDHGWKGKIFLLGKSPSRGTTQYSLLISDKFWIH